MSVPDRIGSVRDGDAFSGALAGLRRRWLVVVAVLIASVAVVVVSHEHKAKSYSATASVAFQSATLSDSALQVAPAGSSEPQREADTEVLIAHSSEVAEAVRRQLHIQSSANELLGLVKVEAAPTADVLNVIADTHNPAYSASLANAFAEQYIDFQTNSQLADIETAQTKLERQIATLPEGSAERATLVQSLQRLGALRAVAGGGANIIGRATPPSSPTGASLTTAIVIGLLIGLAIAFSLGFLLESLDRRIKTIEEFERAYRVPALAGIPQSVFRLARDPKGDGVVPEPYRILRSALDFTAVARPLNTLLVTSAVAGEGKTTVAVNLARAIALTGRRTVLVELDLRRPSFAGHFQLDPGTGLTTVLTGRGQLSAVLIEPFSDLPNLHVLPSGQVPHNPSELLGSSRIAAIISELASEGGMVIIDAPPLNPVADTQELLNTSVIDAVLLVGRVDRTMRDAAHRARAILDRHVVEPVGIVVTGIRDAGRYGYGPYEGSAQVLKEYIQAPPPRLEPTSAVELGSKVAELQGRIAELDTDLDASSSPASQARIKELRERLAGLQVEIARPQVGVETLFRPVDGSE